MEGKDRVQPSTEVAVAKLGNCSNKDEIDTFHVEVNLPGVTDPNINDMLDCYLDLSEMEVIK